MRAKVRHGGDTAWAAWDTTLEFRPSGLPAQGLCLVGHILVGLACWTSIQSWAFHHPLVSLFKIRWGGEGVYKVRDVCCKILDNLENDERENKTHLYSIPEHNTHL